MKAPTKSCEIWTVAGADTFFADTYALVELARENPAYSEFAIEQLVTTQFQAVEFYEWLIRSVSEPLVNEVYEPIEEKLFPISPKVIRHAAQIHVSERKHNLSYADCVGYAFALEQSIPFLTGDKQFKDMPGVRFVR